MITTLITGSMRCLELECLGAVLQVLRGFW
jgi:hypothetical protein